MWTFCYCSIFINDNWKKSVFYEIQELLNRISFFTSTFLSCKIQLTWKRNCGKHLLGLCLLQHHFYDTLKLTFFFTVCWHTSAHLICHMAPSVSCQPFLFFWLTTVSLLVAKPMTTPTASPPTHAWQCHHHKALKENFSLLFIVCVYGDNSRFCGCNSWNELHHSELKEEIILICLLFSSASRCGHSSTHSWLDWTSELWLVSAFFFCFGHILPEI